MPSDSHKAKATGLIFSLLALAQEVPFAIPLYTQWILHGPSFVPHSFFTTKSVDFVVGM